MIEFKCSIDCIQSDYFTAACVKLIEKNNNLVKFLKPSRQGICNAYFKDFCVREFKKRNLGANLTLDEIEQNFGFEFCVFENGYKRNQNLKISKLPSFERPIVFVRKQKIQKNESKVR